MLTKEQLVTTEMSHREILRPEDFLSEFESNWFDSLRLIPEGSASNIRPRGEVFETLVTQRFPEMFFQVDERLASAALVTKLVEGWAATVPADHFMGGMEGVIRFCQQVVPLVESARTDVAEVYGPDYVGNRLIRASVGAYSGLLDHFGQIPLTNNARERFGIEIGDALDVQSMKQEGVLGVLTKKPLETGLNPRYSP